MPADGVVSVSGTERGHDTGEAAVRWPNGMAVTWCACSFRCGDVRSIHDTKGAVCKGLPGCRRDV